MNHNVFLTIIIIIGLMILIIFPKKETIISAFRISNEPIVISKGNYGQSLIVEISFSHEGLHEWINQLEKPYPLFMLEPNWIERSPDIIELIKDKNIPTGLYGNINDDNFSIEKFEKEIAIYEKFFKTKPLWYMTSNYKYTSELKQIAFNEKINLVSPTFIYTNDTTQNSEGAIVSIQIHEKSKPNYSNINEFIKSQQFISIEENIFGYDMKSKKAP